MHNAQLLRVARIFCYILLDYASCIMHRALNCSSILTPKPMRHLFTNLPHFLVEILKKTLLSFRHLYFFEDNLGQRGQPFFLTHHFCHTDVVVVVCVVFFTNL